MTVKELMERLAQFDENAKVMVQVDGWDEVVNYVEEHDEGEIVIYHI